MTIENTGNGTFTTALYNNNSSPVIENVTATVSGGTNNTGVYNYNNAAPSMTNAFVTATGGTTSTGVLNVDYVNLLMTNVLVQASGGATTNIGVASQSYGATALTNVNVSASGGATNVGVHISANNSTNIRQSTISSGGTYAIVNVGPSVCVVIRSSINGDAFNGGTLSCVNSDNGFDTVLNATCQ